MSNSAIRNGLLAATALGLLSTGPVYARDGGRTTLTPYVEFDQVVFADLKDGGDVLTYSTVAAGLDGSVESRDAQAQFALRFERLISYDDQLDDENTFSGIARGALTSASGLRFDAGALGSRTRVDARGSAPGNLVGNPDNVTQVYSLYAGPSFTNQIGDLTVNAGYQLGYTRVEEKLVGSLPPGAPPLDLFDDSVTHSASASVGMQPGDLPFGWSVGVGLDREDAGQLDQRYEARHARADVTVPVSGDLAMVGGVGYEDVEVSERDALRDAAGVPILGGDGRLVTDKSSPRLLAYDQDGIIWDAGVLWRPSRRTSLEARVGRRYGSTTWFGNANWSPSDRTTLNLSVYDMVTGFGGLLNDNLSRLGTSFTSYRNPLSGDLSGCAFGKESSLCFNDALLSASSATFRGRGVTASLSTEVGGWNYGAAAGYSRRKYLVSALGARSSLGGVVDENYFAVMQMGRRLDERSSFDASFYGNYVVPGQPGFGDVVSLGANAAYNRNIWRGLEATAAVGIDGTKQEDFDSAVTASALLGLRYSF